LTVPRGTPILIVLSKPVRIRREGAALKGEVSQTVFAFDQPVIPEGSQVLGHVTRIAPVPKLRRALAITNADFSPAHEYTVTFDTIVFQDGRRLPITTTVAPGTAEVVHLVSDPQRAAQKKNAVAQAAQNAKHEAHTRIHHVIDEIKSPGRAQRIKKFLIAELPYRRQYINAGTAFNADLDMDLNFGSEERPVEQLNSQSTKPDDDTLLHARLAQEVNSATAHRGTPVEAVLTEPIFNSSHQLLLPANTRMIGDVTYAKPASRLHRNGELRLMFIKLETPDGHEQNMQGSLAGVEVDKAANLKLDPEGGAHARDNKSRYLSTGLAIGVAALAAHPESDNGAPDGLADPATHTAAGASGFKLVGAVVSLASSSKAFSSVLAVYGASLSVYSHLLSRGRDVVLPKDTPVEIILSEKHNTVGHAESGR